MATPLTRVEHRSSEADLDAMWAEQENAWHLGFALIWASTFVVVVLAPAGHLGRLPEMALLVVLAVVYAAFGVPGMRAGGERRGHAYLVLAWLCVLGMQVLNADTQSWLLYFILFPHLWVVLHTRLAIITTVLILAALAVMRIAQSDGSREVLTSIGLSSVISLGLSLALGLFIDRILREAQTRAPHALGTDPVAGDAQLALQDMAAQARIAGPGVDRQASDRARLRSHQRPAIGRAVEHHRRKRPQHPAAPTSRAAAARSRADPHRVHCPPSGIQPPFSRAMFPA